MGFAFLVVGDRRVGSGQLFPFASLVSLALPSLRCHVGGHERGNGDERKRRQGQ